MNPYNGFSSTERNANQRALNKAVKSGTVDAPGGVCALCGDPDAKLEYHSEDYSKPYTWTPPAAYALCRHCHRDKLHKRFSNPQRWETFKAHVRRGGYASDLADPTIKRELAADEQVRRSGGLPADLRALRPYRGQIGKEWWNGLVTTPGA